MIDGKSINNKSVLPFRYSIHKLLVVELKILLDLSNFFHLVKVSHVRTFWVVLYSLCILYIIFELLLVQLYCIFVLCLWLSYPSPLHYDRNHNCQHSESSQTPSHNNQHFDWLTFYYLLNGTQNCHLDLYNLYYQIFLSLKFNIHSILLSYHTYYI